MLKIAHWREGYVAKPVENIAGHESVKVIAAAAAALPFSAPKLSE